jgi:ELWxxDGT repeat protein
MTAVGNKTFFTVDPTDSDKGIYIAVTDGTAAGTGLLVGFEKDYPTNFTAVGNKLYFTVDDGDHGNELWVSDGFDAHIVNGAISSDPESLCSYNGLLYFTATSLNQRRLMRTDGTAAGTVVIANVSATGTTVSNGFMYFLGYDGSTSGLWKSDGTAPGTSLVKKINPGGTESLLQLTDVNGTLFFEALTTAEGRELWKSDGTAAGTVLVKDIRPGTANSGLQNMKKVGPRLFFSADNGVNGRELWVSDGTSPGTQLVKDASASATTFPGTMLDVNGTLFYEYYDGRRRRSGSPTALPPVRARWRTSVRRRSPCH